ncbi:MAG: YkgJ family cysteine cluster protein [Desulfarculus sp.]|nr:YkgJ family cysteine cluster protein [Desulfarculus sp.]
MQLDSDFCYHCLRCSRCCHDQAIQVNPYEILRLARHLGLSTSQFIERHTTNAGLFLRFTSEGACGFLTPQGCGVHPARPLVCRLYPLGREIDLQEGEGFVLLERHPQCPALVGGAGRLGEYLDEQGAGPFLAAADLYLELVLEMHEALRRHAPLGAGGETLAGLGRSAVQAVNPWLDVDAVLGDAVLEADPWRAMQRHLVAIRKWTRQMEGEESNAH